MSHQGQLIQKTIRLHLSLPDNLRARLSGRSVSTPIPRSVRSRMRQPEDITIAECAARYRRVTGVDSKPGPWRNDHVPHAVEAMNLFQQPWVKEIWLCWPERTAKTNVMLNCLAAVTKGVRNLTPGNCFWLEPAEDDGGTNVKTKIIPMYRESPKLKKYLSARADDTGKKLIAFSHGMHLFPASANSARTMANFFGKYCFGNEVDKYPAMVGTETDPIKLIRKRGREVRNSKFMFGSTPAGKFIYKGTMACHQVKKLHNRCPHCGDLVLMDDDHLVIPEGATADQVENGEVQVGYACNSCGAEWDEFDRERSYHLCAFVAVKGAEVKRPLTVGLHASALPFPMIPLSEIAGKYLRSKDGNHADKVDYSHGYQVIDYEPETAAILDKSTVLKFRSELPRNLVPPDTAKLVIIIDTQQYGFYYQVWAIGYGPDYPLHMVRHGHLETFAEIEDLVSARWETFDGKQYAITDGYIDSGGTKNQWQKHSRTVEVYEWCSNNRTVRPIKGNHGGTGELITHKNITTYPGTDKPIKGGLTRYNIQVSQFKNQLADKLAKEPDDTGALSFHCDIDEDFAKHYTSEYKDENNEWQHDKKKGRNDYFDCTVYLLAWMWKYKSFIPAKDGAKITRRIISRGVTQ